MGKMPKREFKKPKREKVAKGNLKAKTGKKPKREFKPKTGILGEREFNSR